MHFRGHTVCITCSTYLPWFLLDLPYPMILCNFRDILHREAICPFLLPRKTLQCNGLCLGDDHCSSDWCLLCELPDIPRFWGNLFGKILEQGGIVCFLGCRIGSFVQSCSHLWKVDCFPCSKPGKNHGKTNKQTMDFLAIFSNPNSLAGHEDGQNIVKFFVLVFFFRWKSSFPSNVLLCIWTPCSPSWTGPRFLGHSPLGWGELGYKVSSLCFFSEKSNSTIHIWKCSWVFLDFLFACGWAKVSNGVRAWRQARDVRKRRIKSGHSCDWNISLLVQPVFTSSTLVPPSSNIIFQVLGGAIVSWRVSSTEVSFQDRTFRNNPASQIATQSSPKISIS